MPTNRRRKKGSSEFTQGDSPVYSMDAFYIVFEKILFSFNKRNILFQDLELESGFLLSIDCPNSCAMDSSTSLVAFITVVQKRRTSCEQFGN